MAYQVRCGGGRRSLAFSFFAQGAAFRAAGDFADSLRSRTSTGYRTGCCPSLLAAVPVILAGVGSVCSRKRLVKRVRPVPGAVRWSQPVVLLGAARGRRRDSLSGGRSRSRRVRLCRSAGRLDEHARGEPAEGVRAQHHASGSTPRTAWAGSWGRRWRGSGRTGDPSLFVSYLPVSVVPAGAVPGGEPVVRRRWRGPGGRRGSQERGAQEAGRVVFRMPLPLCLVMCPSRTSVTRRSPTGAPHLQDALGELGAAVDRPVQRLHGQRRLVGRAMGDVECGSSAVLRCGWGPLRRLPGSAVVAVAPGPWVGMLGFTLLGLSVCDRAADLRRRRADVSQGVRRRRRGARLNIFNYVGFLRVRRSWALWDAWSYRGAMLVPMALVLVTPRVRPFVGGVGGPIRWRA